MVMNKKLVKKNQGRVICGVCAGIAEYMGIDPTIVRLVWVISCLVTGIGVPAYVIAAVLIPLED